MQDKNIGKTIGIYTILDICNERAKDGHLLYLCKCNICGIIVTRRLDDAKNCHTCKHISISGAIIDNKSKWSNQRIKRIFYDMIKRCYNKNDKDYKYYGEKGVCIYDEWLQHPESFEIWALNNGYSDELTIDRIDSNKGYNPNNCQWIPLADNSRKSGNVNWIEVNGKQLTGRQWAEKFGLGVNTINRYIRIYGLDKTKELISAMLKSPPNEQYSKHNQSWFDIYHIDVK